MQKRLLANGSQDFVAQNATIEDQLRQAPIPAGLTLRAALCVIIVAEIGGLGGVG